MKNSILTFLLGVFVTISIAATAPNTELFTVKPATPKSIISLYDNAPKINLKILEYSKKGYIVKHLSLSINNNGVRVAILVMEKY